MSEKNELHKLIHSLTPNEKAYFKKFAYKSKDDKENPYLVLFDAILKQEEYDEETVKQKLKNTKLVNNFSAAKNYLTDLIVSTFASIQENNSVENKLLAIILQFPFLMERRVNNLLQKKIQLAKKMAYDYELYNYYATIHNYECLILEVDKTYETRKNKLNEEYKAIQDKITNIYQYQQLKDEWLMIRQDTNAYIREQSKIDFVKEKLARQLLNDEHHAITTASKILFYYVRVGYALMLNDVAAAYADSVSQYLVLKENPNYCKANEKEVIVTLSNFVLRMLNVSNYEYFDEVKNTLLQYLENSKDIDLVQSKKLNLALVEKNQYLKQNRFDKIYELLPAYMNVMDFYTKRQDIQLSMLYDIAIIYFYNDQFEECLEFISKVLNHKALHTMIDLESYCLLLRLFVFIEMNQVHHFDTNIENLRRKLYRDDKMFKSENAILKMLAEYSLANSNAKKVDILTEHKKNIETILQDKLEQNIINYFPIHLWLEAKLEHKTIYQKFNNKQP
jgi:hypothetical protein